MGQDTMIGENHLLLFGDCLQRLDALEDKSVDMVFADLPYGTTYAAWDCPIDLVLFWKIIGRVVKDRAAIVLTATQPFSSLLVASNIKQFRTEWIWDKVNGSNFANANKHPLKVHEHVLVFSREACDYFPVKTKGKPNHKQGKSKNKSSELMAINGRVSDDLSGMKFPKSILTFPKHSSQYRHHPTEKPVDLVSYFLHTYSLPGQLVLDPTMGSGSTGVACAKFGRLFVGVEKDSKYFEIAKQRITMEDS